MWARGDRRKIGSSVSDDSPASPPAPPDSNERREFLERINDSFCRMVPHNRALGMEVLDFGAGVSVARLPWNPALIGNPDYGILHGGAVSSLIDATCGSAVFSKLMLLTPIATLDLRIDYLRPATTGRDVFARADCYRVTRNVAFVRAVAYHDHPEDPIASAAGTFMIATPGATVMRHSGFGDAGARPAGPKNENDGGGNQGGT